jgi:hypothetical protein
MARMEPAAAVENPPAGPRVRRRRGYRRSGFYALKTTLRQLGPRVIDKRTSIGKALAAWRADLVRDLGGHDALSTQQHAMVELLCRQKLLLESLDAWLLVQPSLVNARKGSLLPVMRERQQVADALARYLAQLGLQRQTAPLDVAATPPRRRRRRSCRTAPWALIPPRVLHTHERATRPARAAQRHTSHRMGRGPLATDYPNARGTAGRPTLMPAHDAVLALLDWLPEGTEVDAALVADLIDIPEPDAAGFSTTWRRPGASASPTGPLQ